MKKIVASLIALCIAAVTLTGCSERRTEEAKSYDERYQLSKQYDTTESLELNNLREKRSREDDESSIRYLYLMNFGEIVGYYVTKGKVSSNGSQIAPLTEFVRPCTSCDREAVESAQDDGSYGQDEEGIFFFTTDGTMVVTSLDYIQSDAPLAIDVPRLGGNDK